MSLPPPVLVVEDDPVIARALRRELSLYSVPSTVASTVRQAALLDRAFAVAIVDINLPDGNGLELFEDLVKRRIVGSGVFFSASADKADLERARQLGKLVSKSSGVTAAVRAALALTTIAPPASHTRPASSPELCAELSPDAPKTGFESS